MGCKILFEVGNARRVHFLLDRWYGDWPLNEEFPSLLSIAIAKKVWVGEVWSGLGE